ncbi:hypothetical protein MnTg04_01713 [bacterium MnTg04]|nr:hypothetical protein MnTg04_01713 [bacterium MnTg04]
MLYAIIGRAAPECSELPASARPAHLARPQQPTDASRLVHAGRFPAIYSEDSGFADFAGSLMVLP